MNSVLADAGDQVQLGIVRDREYLHWRFALKLEVQHSTYVYQENGAIGGYIVLGVLEGEQADIGLVMDVLALPDRDDIVRALFVKAFLHFIREQVGKVRFGMMAQGAIAQTVRHLFMHCRERPMCGQAYGGIDPSFALDGANWTISFADADFF